MKVEYFPRKISIFQREIWSYLRTVSSRVIEKFLCQALGWFRTLYTGLAGYSKTVSGENFLRVTLEPLRTLCTGSAKRTTFEFFPFLKALEDCK